MVKRKLSQQRSFQEQQQQQQQQDEKQKPEKPIFRCTEPTPKVPLLPIRTATGRCHNRPGQWVVSSSETGWQTCDIKTLEKGLFRYNALPVEKSFLLDAAGVDAEHQSMETMLDVYEESLQKQISTQARRPRTTRVAGRNAVVYTGLFCPLHIQLDKTDDLATTKQKIKNEIDILLEALARRGETFATLLGELLPDKDLVSPSDMTVFVSCGPGMEPRPFTENLAKIGKCRTQKARQGWLVLEQKSAPERGSWLSTDTPAPSRNKDLWQSLSRYNRKELVQQLRQDMPEQQLEKKFGFHYRDLERSSLVPDAVFERFVRDYVQQADPPRSMQTDMETFELYVVFPEMFYATPNVFYRAFPKNQKPPEGPVLRVPYHTKFLVSFVERIEPFNDLYLYILSHPGERFSPTGFRRFVGDLQAQLESVNRLQTEMASELSLSKKFTKLPRYGIITKPYQAFVAEYVLENPGLLCYHDAGTGKTLTAISAILSFLHQSKDHLVVVVSPASVVLQWRHEVHSFIVPSPDQGSLQKGYAQSLETRRRILTLSYEKLFLLMQHVMTRKTTPNPDDVEILQQIENYRGRCLFVLDEVHEIPSRFLQRTDSPPSWFREALSLPADKKIPCRVPTGAYWVRTACALFGKRLLCLSATPFVNQMSDLQILFYNVMIMNQPIARRDMKKLLLWDRLVDSTKNLGITEEELRTPALPNALLPQGCATTMTPRLNHLFLTRDQDEFERAMPELLRFFGNFHGMIHRIVRGGGSEFPPVKVYDHILMVKPDSPFMRHYLEYIQEGLLEPRIKPSLFEQAYLLQSNLFKNQRIMSSRVYQKPPPVEGLPPHRAYTRTVNGKRVAHQIRETTGERAVKTLKKRNLTKPLGNRSDDILEGGVFSPKLAFLLGRLSPPPPHLAGPDCKTVIYAFFDDNVRLITEALKRLPFGYALPTRPLVFSITGATPLRKRQAIVQRFNQSGGNIILVISTAAATGIDLKAVSDIVFFEQVWTNTLYTQIVGRGVRYLSHIGISNPLVRVHNLILKTDATVDNAPVEFIDDFMYSIVKKKRVMTERFDRLLALLCDDRYPYGTPGLLSKRPATSGALRTSPQRMQTQEVQQIIYHEN